MESKTLLDREELAMDVKEAAKRAAAYTADIETVMDPKSLSEFLSKSGFAIESTHFDDAHNRWEIGVGFVREFDRGGIDGIASLSSVWDRMPLQGTRTYKTVTLFRTSSRYESDTRRQSTARASCWFLR